MFILKKELFCHSCNDYKEVDIITRNEVYMVKDEEIEVEAKICICKSCGEELFDMELDEINIEKAFEKYRKKHGLLTPNEIRNIREMYGISQRAFARLLKWGEITVNRYEMGAIQDKAHNNILILLKNPANMLSILENNTNALSTSKEKQLREKITLLLSENAITELENTILDNINSSNDIYSGFKYFDYEKFKSIVLYFAYNETKLFKTKLMKLLWYTDNLFFKENTTSITGLQYACLPRGPVIENRNLLLGLLEKQGVISMIEDEETNGEYVIPKSDMGEISLEDEELAIAKKVSERFKNFNCKQISDYSHEEKGWKENKIGNLISYNFAKYINID